MAKLRLHRLFVLLLLTACAGQTTVVVVDVASVVVAPDLASVEVGLTLQLQASAFDASGTEIMGQAATWESTVTGVATISASGVATGMSVGSTVIRATIGGVTGSRTLAVDPTSCVTRTDVILSPGSYMSFPGEECLLLPAGAPGDLYRVAIVRPTLIADSTNSPMVTLDLSPVLTPAAADETPAPVVEPAAVLRRDEGPKIDSRQALEHLRRMEVTRRFHNALRMRERDLGLDPSLRLPNLAGAAGPVRTSHLSPPPATRDLYLGLTCGPSTTSPVQLISYDDNLAIYQETAEWSTDPISPADATELLTYFDSYVKDMIVAYWGAVPDTDANGRMVVTTTQSLDGAAAAVFSGDFYSRIGPPGANCPSSNEGEFIYFDGELLVALDDADPDAFALGVVAHEAKHVISLYHGIQRGPNPPNFNDLWIEEGTAEVSQVMSSRIAWAATGGPAVGARITGQDIRDGLQNNMPTPEMSALVDALGGMVYSLSAQPNSVITDPAGAPSTHSFYATSWLWHRFLGDGFGNASTAYADSAFFRELTSASTPAGGASGEIQITGRSFDQLFEDFVVGVSLHQTGHNPPYAITTWDFVSSADIFANPNPPGSFPWPVTADNADSWDPYAKTTYSGRIGPSGVRFHDFRSSGTAGAQISVTGSNQPCVQNPSVRCDRIIVSRIN